MRACAGCTILVALLSASCASTVRREALGPGPIHLFQVASVSEENMVYLDRLCKPKSTPAVLSIAEALSSPKKLEGQTVTISGYYGLAEDESALYKSQRDLDHRITKNGIWIDGAFDPKLAGRYIRVTGVVTSMPQWKGFSWPLTVCGVESIRPENPL
jgi:hypothetical protein